MAEGLIRVRTSLESLVSVQQLLALPLLTQLQMLPIARSLLEVFLLKRFQLCAPRTLQRRKYYLLSLENRPSPEHVLRRSRRQLLGEFIPFWKLDDVFRPLKRGGHGAGVQCLKLSDGKLCRRGVHVVRGGQ